MNHGSFVSVDLVKPGTCHPQIVPSGQLSAKPLKCNSFALRIRTSWFPFPFLLLLLGSRLEDSDWRMLATLRSCTRCPSRSVFRSVFLPSLGLLPGPRTTMSTSADPIEEEILPRYSPQNYYPVSIAQVFDKRYKVLAKLGFGGESTTWLAQDTNRCVGQSFVDFTLASNNFLDGGCRKIDLSPSKFSRRMRQTVIPQAPSWCYRSALPKRIPSMKVCVM
jgi:hypothetical protein